MGGIGVLGYELQARTSGGSGGELGTSDTLAPAGYWGTSYKLAPAGVAQKRESFFNHFGVELAYWGTSCKLAPAGGIFKVEKVGFSPNPEDYMIPIKTIWLKEL